MSSRPRSDIPRPFLKWAGGKTQLLPQFERLYPSPESFSRYLEPFVGSAAVYLHVRRLFAPREVVLADGNEDLINVYRAVQDDVEGVIRRLARHRSAHSEAHYYQTRARKPAALSAPTRAARTIYLNKTCFNGLYRVNSRGEFNVPMGRYRNPSILDAENLRAAALALDGVELRIAHFRETLEYARRGDFVYFDPPYQPLTRTSAFTAYTRDTFTPADQEELAQIFRRLSERGCRVMLSNSDSPLIHRLYQGFDLRRVDARRAINSKGDRRGRISELVVLNYEPPSTSADARIPGPTFARVEPARTGSSRRTRGPTSRLSRTLES